MTSTHLDSNPDHHQDLNEIILARYKSVQKIYPNPINVLCNTANRQANEQMLNEQSRLI